MKRAPISIVSAISEKTRAIGLKNQLLWRLPKDLEHFKNLTTGHTVVMGYNTFLSVGQALPNRNNIIIAKEKVETPANCLLFTSIPEALDKAQEIESAKPDGEVFIIGGGQIYQQTIDLADRLYLTLVKEEKEGDTYFPDYSQFHKKISEEEHNESVPPFSFVTLEK